MAIPLVAGAVARLGGKEVAKKEALKQITPQNAIPELLSFNDDYASDNIEILDSGKIINRTITEDGKVIDSVKEIAEDLGNAVGKDKAKVQVEATEELLDEAKEKTKEATKPTSKTKEKFENGNPKKLTNAIKSLPTVGGIGLLLGIIIFILFAIQPVNGRTRLSLLWNSIIGRTYIGDNDPSQKQEFISPVDEAIQTVGAVVEKTTSLPNVIDMVTPGLNSEAIKLGSSVFVNGAEWIEEHFDPLKDWLGGKF